MKCSFALMQCLKCIKSSILWLQKSITTRWSQKIGTKCRMNSQPIELYKLLQICTILCLSFLFYSPEWETLVHWKKHLKNMEVNCSCRASGKLLEWFSLWHLPSANSRELTTSHDMPSCFYLHELLIFFTSNLAHDW